MTKWFLGCATFRTREGQTYEVAWGRRLSETKCSDLCHKSVGFPRWNSWKLPASSPWTASSPRKESLERTVRRSVLLRAWRAPGRTLRLETHSDRCSSWKLKTRRWTAGCCAEVCIHFPWSCLSAAPSLPRSPSTLFDGAVSRLRTATPAQDSSFDKRGGAMHLRVAREVESIRISVSSGNGREHKIAGPVPGPSPVHRALTNQIANLTLWRRHARFWLAVLFFFLHGKSRGLWKEREVNHTDPLQSEAIDGPHRVTQTNFSAINQWGGLSWPFPSISRPLCCDYSLSYSPSETMNRTQSHVFISNDAYFILFLKCETQTS